MYRNITGKSLKELVSENAVLYATPDEEQSWDSSNHVLAWTISMQEPDGLHVRIDLGSEAYARAFSLERLWEARVARCPVCGKIDHWENLYAVDTNPLIYGLHDWCTPVYVYEPQALEYLADHYHEVPGVWGWDSEGGFVGIRDLDLIQEFLDARGIQYMTG